MSPFSQYGGYEGDFPGDLRYVRHLTRAEEYVIVGTAPTVTSFARYEPVDIIPDSNFLAVGDDSREPKQTRRLVRYRLEKKTLSEWVSQNSEVILLDEAIVHVFGYYRIYIAWFWVPDE